MSSQNELLLPQNIDAERTILGVAMTDEAAMSTVRSILSTEDFALDAHKRIWGAALAVFDSGSAVDRVTLANRLMKTGELEAVGGVSGICDLDANLPPIVSLDSYIRIVRDKSAYRKIARFAESIVQRAVLAQDSPQAILDGLGGGLVALDGAGAHKRPWKAADAINEIGVDTILMPRRRRGLRFPQEWDLTNRWICGMHPGQMFVLAADTSRGKTSMALQIAAGALQSTGVLYVSTEMMPDQIIRRMVTQRSRVDYERSRQAALTPDERAAELDALNWLSQRPFFIDETITTVQGVHAAIRKLRTQHEIGLVVVDYLQHLRCIGRYESRAKEVGANSRALKQAAMEFQVPFLVLSQFHRPEKGSTARPTLHNLKESGDIENDSDVILLIIPDPNEDDRSNPRHVDLQIAKQREGPRETVRFQFRPNIQRFDEVM
jgi:replicative DNA helicase